MLCFVAHREAPYQLAVAHHCLPPWKKGTGTEAQWWLEGADIEGASEPVPFFHSHSSLAFSNAASETAIRGMLAGMWRIWVANVATVFSARSKYSGLSSASAR